MLIELTGMNHRARVLGSSFCRPGRDNSNGVWVLVVGCANCNALTFTFGSGHRGVETTAGAMVLGIANCTPDPVCNCVIETLGAAGWDSTFGWGRVNAARAVSLAGSAILPADTTPPTVAVLTPTAGSIISGTLTVQASASDNAGVSGVALYLDGVLIAGGSNASLSFPWNTLTSSNGAHTLQAVATDTSGNTATSQITVTVNNVSDTTAPAISITSPADGAKVSRTVSVTVSVSDNVGVVKVELYVDGKLTGTSTSQPLTSSWNPRKAVSGGHTLQCKAYDAAANAALSQLVTVYK